MPVRSDLDRSTAFTILLDVDSEFGAMDVQEGRKRVTVFLEAWYASDARDMYRFAVEWVRHHPVQS